MKVEIKSYIAGNYHNYHCVIVSYIAVRLSRDYFASICIYVVRLFVTFQKAPL